MIVKKLKITFKDFIFENYHQRLWFANENSCYSMKHQENKDLQLFATKLTKKYLILVKLKNTISHF